MRERVVLDVACAVAKCLELGQPLGRLDAGGNEIDLARTAERASCSAAAFGEAPRATLSLEPGHGLSSWLYPAHRGACPAPARRSADSRSCRPALRRRDGPHRRLHSRSACRPCSSGSRDRRRAACRRRSPRYWPPSWRPWRWRCPPIFHAERTRRNRSRRRRRAFRPGEPRDRGEQAARLLRHSEFAQPRAGIVVGGGAVSARSPGARRVGRPGS